MKFLLAFFFLCFNFGNVGTSLNSKNNSFEEVKIETKDFQLDEQILQQNQIVSKIELDSKQTKEQIFEFGIKKSLIQKVPLKLEIDKKLFLQLQNYIDHDLKYTLNYSAFVTWKNPKNLKPVRFLINFNVNFTKDLEFQAAFDVKEQRTFWFQEHNFKYFQDYGLIVNFVKLDLVQIEKKFYLQFESSFGINFYYFIQAFKFYGSVDFQWETIVNFTSLKIEIINRKINLNQVKPYLFKFNFNGTITDFEQIKEQFILKFFEIELPILETNYLKANFNWEEFYNDFLRITLNPLLLINEFLIPIHTKNFRNYQGSLMLKIIFITQIEVELEFEKNYKTTNLDDLIFSLENFIYLNGYNPDYFVFKVQEKEIIISSNNFEFYLFEPKIILYQLINKENNNDKEENSTDTDENILDQEIIIEKPIFNQKYFFLFFIPGLILIIYLAFVFLQKFKNKKSKMIK